MKMSMCGCTVWVGGDQRTKVVRNAFNPVSWPEIEMLKYLHNEEVHDIVVVGEVETNAGDEKTRLLLRYGKVAMDKVYPGARPRFEFTAPKSVPRATQKRRKTPVDHATDPEPVSQPKPVDDDGLTDAPGV